MKLKKIEAWTTSDGQVFTNEAAAISHEKTNEFIAFVDKNPFFVAGGKLTGIDLVEWVEQCGCDALLQYLAKAYPQNFDHVHWQTFRHPDERKKELKK